MQPIQSTKKPAPKDWHKADIKAALEKAGWSFRRLALANGYHVAALDKVLRTPWLRAERIVAATIGVPAEQIWPSRYQQPRIETRRGRKKQSTLNGSTAPKPRNVHMRGVA